MKNNILKVLQYNLIVLLLLVFSIVANAQYKDFLISVKGDTINIVDSKGLKQGKWVNTVGEIRGEPGFDEEGFYKDDKKTGPWRKYTTNGDVLAIENYIAGGKAGAQQYFNYLGMLMREEEWKAYNPDAPYDTIPVYAEGNNEVSKFKIVKAQQYSVEHGEWKYYNETGHIIRIEHYDRGNLLKGDVAKKETAATEKKPEEKAKPQEVLDYEKKYSKKKGKHVEREGRTSL